MAKGHKKDGMEILVWEIFRGTGRQTGRSLARGLEKELKKRTLDSSSSHRKLIDRFTLPGNFKGAANKMYTLIDSFYNEYVTTKAIFQSSFYLQDDIEYIERKLQFTERLIFTDPEERAYQRLLNTWIDYKEQAKKAK